MMVPAPSAVLVITSLVPSRSVLIAFPIEVIIVPPPVAKVDIVLSMKLVRPSSKDPLSTSFSFR